MPRNENTCNSKRRTAIGIGAWKTFFPTLVLLAWSNVALATTWYVDNRTGDDGNDGSTATTAFGTIARALKAAGTSDTISLANTGVAYREPIVLTRRGGTPAQPMVIEGNGATISGLRVIAPERWQRVVTCTKSDVPSPTVFRY